MNADSCLCGCGQPPRNGRNYTRGHTRPKDITTRIMNRIRVSEAGCWEWQGSRSPLGYGTFCVTTGLYRGVHRVLYQELRGPLPSDMHLDHLCRNPPCCNPDHLEPVTARENVARGTAPTMRAHLAGKCMQGHDLATEAYLRKSTGRVVQCRACRREKRSAR